MKNKAYQASHYDQPCSCAYEMCSGLVTGHHLRISDLSGTSMKAGDEFAIPVCDKHHKQCHAAYIDKEEQVKMLALYWLERMIQKHGMVKALKMMGADYVRNMELGG